MHHLTTDKILKALPQNATHRLGLSATLITKYEDDNMESLKKYFGGIVFSFSMQSAISGGYLTKYNYYPIFVDLTEQEKEEYYAISNKIRSLAAINSSRETENNKGLMALLSQRARLIASANNKLVKLKEFGDLFSNSAYNLVYCGDKIETETNEKFVDKVTNILKEDFGIYTRKFTSEQNKKDREIILRQFGHGIIKALTAIRCLDEGIDIPQLRRAFILSSGSNPREFIQRRGRILRKYPGKLVAEIYDFIVFPTLDEKELLRMSYEEKMIEKKIIGREYERLKEFADMAENGLDAYEKFLKVWELYS